MTTLGARRVRTVLDHCDDRAVQRLGLRCSPGDGERRLPLVGRGGRPHLLDAGAGVGVRVDGRRSRNPQSGHMLLTFVVSPLT